jgi:hypothetical protein
MEEGMGRSVFCAVLCCFIVTITFGATSPASGSVSPGSGILQFRAGGHVLGFAPNRAYLVALDHALGVEFLGTPGVTPQTVSSSPAAGAASQASPPAEVVYRELWNGITLTYHMTGDGIAESVYNVSPGANVSAIRLCYKVPVELQKDGSLKITFESGYMTESPPISWQDINGKRIPVKVAFRTTNGEIGFSVDEYDKKYPLTIDPTYAWHTFYGTSNDGSIGYNIAVDGSGDIYVVGKSGATWGSPLHPHSGGNDIVVLKLNSSGEYQWHTFYGSSSADEGFGIALDGSGNIFVTGHSGATWGSPLNAYNKSYDILVLKLNSSGAYQWHTFLGSDNYEVGRNIALDASGNIYVTGYGNKTWGSPLNAYNDSYDIFALKLNSSGTYLWHTFFGSAGIDYAWDIALDSSSNVYVTGQSFATWGSPINSYTGTTGTANVYALKLNSSGVYQWHTFYPALWGWAIAVDKSSNVYVTGRSDLAWGSPVNVHSGNSDGYVLKLNSSGAYIWNTFFGVHNTNDAFDMTVDGAGNVFVAGTSDASWGSPLTPYSGGMDIYVLNLDSTGARQWNTFYGSSVSGKNDTGWGLVLDGSGNLYVTGQSWATWGSPLNLHSGGSYPDIFVLKLNEASVVLEPSVTTSTPSAITNTTATSGGTVTTDGGATVTARGVCWGMSANPTTTTDNHTSNGTGTGSFTSAISGLSATTSYHVRGYAVNSVGTAYGEDISFTTNLCAIDVQRGGTSYGTIQEAVSSGSGSEIMAVARVFQGDIQFSNSSDLDLTGGYACGFGSTNGVTTVRGMLTIAGNGAVALSNVAVY